MGHEDRGSWDWEQTPQQPVPGELKALENVAKKWRCFVQDHPWAGPERQECDYPNCGCDIPVDTEVKP
jgi:hypothetical protein